MKVLHLCSCTYHCIFKELNRDKMLDLSSMLSLFRNEKIQYKQDHECYIYIIYHMSSNFGVKTLIVCLLYETFRHVIR